MRILHTILTHEFAGTERYIAELSALQAQRHDVTVLIARETCDLVTGGDIGPYLSPQVRIERADRIGYLPALLALWTRLRPDVVHSHVGAASFRAGLLNRLGHTRPGRTLLPADLACPVVATLHRKYVDRTYRRHDGLICIANWQRAEIPDSFRGPVETISNWTQPCTPGMHARQRLRAELGLSDDTVLIGGAGRMVTAKGFDTLVAAFAKAGLCGKTRLVLFGDGPERAALEAQAGPNVIFAGYRQTLPADLPALDAFVMPSRHEPFGLVLLEAMAAGLPVLATRAGGVPDILGDHPTCMIEPDNVMAMAEGLRALRTQGRRTWNMDRFTPQQQVDRIEAFYRTCIDWKRRR